MTIDDSFFSVYNNWLLILKLVDYLEDSKYSVKIGRTIFRNICYVLTRSGMDKGLKFVKGTYGPYSSDVKKMQIHVRDSFEIDTSSYSKKDRENANKTFDLFRRIKDTDQAEMVTTLLFSYDQLSEQRTKVTENSLYEYIINWKKKYATSNNEYKLRELAKNLISMQLINVDYSRDFKQYDLY